MSTFDKERLIRALKPEWCNKTKDFAWVEANLVNPLTICIENDLCKIPVSLLDVEKLKAFTCKSVNNIGNNLFPGWLNQCRETSPSSHFSFKFENDSLMSLIQDRLKIPHELATIEVEYSQIQIFETGSGNKRIFRSQFHDDHLLGSVLIQIPVEGGHEGGNLYVKYDDEEKIFDHHSESDTKYYTTVILNPSEHRIEPLTRGCNLIATFNLKWKNTHFNGMPKDALRFLTSFHQVQQVFDCWNPYAVNEEPTQQEENPANASVEEQKCSENGKIDESDNEDYLESCDGDYECGNHLDSWCSSCRWVLPSLKKEILYFPLEAGNCEIGINFRDLVGQDRDTALALKSLSFLEVVIATVMQVNDQNCIYKCNPCYSPYHEKLDRRKSPVSEDCYCYSCSNGSEADDNFEIKAVVDSEGKAVNITLKLNWRKNFSGYGTHLVNTNLSPNEEAHILIVWPKRNSLQIYGLSTLMGRIESSLEIAKNDQETRERLIQELKELVMIWSRGISTSIENYNVSRALRLLRLCARLEAIDGCLAVLKVLGQSLGDISQRQMINCIDQIANVIVRFDWRPAGWQACVELIKQMFTPELFSKQIQLAIKLADGFLNECCAEGAILVGNTAASCWNAIPDEEVNSLTKETVDAYLDFIVSLEQESVTSNPERFSAFFATFSKLKALMQCQLVLDLKSKMNTSLWKTLPSATNFFENLCAALISRQFLTEAVSKERIIIIKLIELYVRLGNREWIQTIISCVIESPYSDSAFVEFISQSSIIWDLATSSELGRLVLTSLMDHLISSLKMDGTSMESISKKNVCTYYGGTNAIVLSTRFSSYLKFLLKMEEHPELANPNRIKTLVSKLKTWNFKHLTDILFDTVKLRSERKNKRPNNLLVIQLFFQLILPRLREEQTTFLPGVVLELMRCFVQYLDQNSICELIDAICIRVSKIPSNRQEISINFFVELIESTFWNELQYPAKLQVLITSATMIETCIAVYSFDPTQDIYHLFTDIYPQAIPTEQLTVSCLQLFFLIEKNRKDDGNAKDLAPGLLNLFSLQPLAAQMESILNVFLLEVSAVPNIKKFSTCIDLYRKMLSLALNQDFLILFTKEDTNLIANLLKCLVWVSDEEAWQSYSSRICQSPSSTVQSRLTETLSQHPTICRMIANSPPALKAITRIAEYAEVEYENISEPTFSWHQPLAVLPEYPEVEEFLRSGSESFVYANFQSINEARHFATSLRQLQVSNKFSVSTRTDGKGKMTRCVIKKTHDYHESLKETVASIRSVLSQLIVLKGTIQLQRDSTSDSSSNQTVNTVISDADSSSVAAQDDVLIIPPLKRPKLDIPIVDILD